MSRKPMSWNDLGNLEVDEAGRLYWNGKAVVLRQRITLGTWELAIAGAAAVAAVVGSTFPIGVHFQWW